jgi:signal transduction histidine kinase
MLDDLGLGAGLEWLATEVRSKSDLEVQTRLEDIGRLEPGLEIALYRVAQEALNNVRKHANASRVLVTIARREGWVRLEVADDGRGIDPSINGIAPGRAPSLGLLGMRERVSPWGGAIRIARGHDGGTVVSADVPAGTRADELAQAA